MNTNNTSASSGQQLFDLRQREDDKWVVWTRKSQADLGMVDRVRIETARKAQFSDAEWAEFLRQPHLSEPTVWVIAAIYDSRPTVDTVLSLLGVKRKPRPEGAKPARPARRKVAPADLSA